MQPAATVMDWRQRAVLLGNDRCSIRCSNALRLHHAVVVVVAGIFISRRRMCLRCIHETKTNYARGDRLDCGN
jgi:hypothetical protein